MYNINTLNAFDYFMTHIKRFASSNGLVIAYNMDFKNKLGTIHLKNCDPIDWAEYHIDWTEVNGIDDVQELIKVITDDAREVFNLKKEEKKKVSSVTPRPKQTTPCKTTTLPEIKKVIYNHPATIVFWADGTKTIAKCHVDDTYTREAGLAWCIAKKAAGGDDKFIDIFNKWVPNKESDKKDVFDQDVTYTNCTDKTCRNCRFCNTSFLANPCCDCWVSGERNKWQPNK